MHIPMRMCIACRQMKPQHELIRIVHEVNTGDVKLDIDKRLMGRGAYICRNSECVMKAEKKKSLARHFKCAVPEKIYHEAQEQILEGKEERMM